VAIKDSTIPKIRYIPDVSGCGNVFNNNHFFGSFFVSKWHVFGKGGRSKLALLKSGVHDPLLPGSAVTALRTSRPISRISSVLFSTATPE